MAQEPRGTTAGLKKVDLHTEYLAGRNVILALASDNVSSAEKDAMATKLKATPNDFPVEMGKPDRPPIYEDSVLADFVNEESWLFFQVSN